MLLSSNGRVCLNIFCLVCLSLVRVDSENTSKLQLDDRPFLTHLLYFLFQLIPVFNLCYLFPDFLLFYSFVNMVSQLQAQYDYLGSVGSWPG